MYERNSAAMAVQPQQPVADGIVEHGDKRGRQLGYPTANIAAGATGVEDGVWFGTVEVNPGPQGKSYYAAISVGRRPTYYDENGVRLIEAFLLDFDGDLYEKPIQVTFIHRLRGQERFESTSELTKQLRDDILMVRARVEEFPLGLTSSVTEPQKRRGWGPVQRSRSRDKTAALQIREERRTASILEAVAACPVDRLVSYAWVSSWTGLRVEYLRRRFPGVGDLQALRQSLPDAPPSATDLAEAS